MHRLDEPHAALRQGKLHAAGGVASRRQPRVRIVAMHRRDERPGERLAFKKNSHAQRRETLRDDFKPVAERAIGTIAADDRLRVAKEMFAMRSARQRDVDPFLTHELVELLLGKLERIRLAAISDLRASGTIEPHVTSRILILESVDRMLARPVANGERIDELRVSRNHIAGEILADEKADRECLAGHRAERRRLEPEIMRRGRSRDAQHQQNFSDHWRRRANRLEKRLDFASAVLGGNCPAMYDAAPVTLSTTEAYGTTAPEPCTIRSSATPVSNVCEVIEPTENCVCVKFAAGTRISLVPRIFPLPSLIVTCTPIGDAGALPVAARNPMFVRDCALLAIPGMYATAVLSDRPVALSKKSRAGVTVSPTVPAGPLVYVRLVMANGAPAPTISAPATLCKPRCPLRTSFSRTVEFAGTVTDPLTDAEA